MCTKFSCYRLDTMREGEFVVYLSDYKLLNKDVAPCIQLLDEEFAPRIQVNYESRCVGREQQRWWWRLGCHFFRDVDLIHTDLDLMISRSGVLGLFQQARVLHLRVVFMMFNFIAHLYVIPQLRGLKFDYRENKSYLECYERYISLTGCLVFLCLFFFSFYFCLLPDDGC